MSAENNWEQETSRKYGEHIQKATRFQEEHITCANQQ